MAKKLKGVVRRKELERVRKETRKLLLDGDWISRHINNVRPAIVELDRQTMKAIAAAPFIAVSNSIK